MTRPIATIFTDNGTRIEVYQQDADGIRITVTIGNSITQFRLKPEEVEALCLILRTEQHIV